MEKYRYRSDHHLKRKIKNIRNLVTYRFAEKTFALLTVIGSDLNSGYSKVHGIVQILLTVISRIFIGWKLWRPAIFLSLHYFSPQFIWFLKLLYFKDMNPEFRQNIKLMYTNKNLFRINKNLFYSDLNSRFREFKYFSTRRLRGWTTIFPHMNFFKAFVILIRGRI